MASIRNISSALMALLLLLLLTAPLSDDVDAGEVRTVSTENAVESHRSDGSLPFIKPQLFETVFADRNLEGILLSAPSAERPAGYALLKSLVADGGVTTVLLRLALLCVFRL